LTDVFLRHEQLPFAYAFRANLDKDQLVISFQEVLERYPILGATVDFSPNKVPTLECQPGDTVPFAFGTSEQTLDEWLLQKKSGNLQHMDWRGGGGPPTLSPLFDDLISEKWEKHVEDVVILEENQEPNKIPTKSNLATVRVTYFREGGTVLGINISHLLGDANSCFRICQVWGRAMRGLAHPLGASNNRSEATLTGMVTPEMVGFLNLGHDAVMAGEAKTVVVPFVSMLGSYWNNLMGVVPVASVEEPIISLDSKPEVGHHEYVRLEFSSDLLQAIKSYGMSRCSTAMAAEGNDTKTSTQDLPTFVSTNDMITAFGWIMKRYIANQPEWNLSMVVNLRSRGEIYGFSCLEDESIGLGVLGNALTSIVAKLPPSHHEEMNISEVGDAAIAIRQSFTKKLANVQDLLILSQSGRAKHAGDQGSCFSTTSWMQFPLWDISFCDKVGIMDGNVPPGNLAGFYGRPSYPLPTGDTYSSIIVPNFSGGCTYKLLAPTRHVQSILQLHKIVSEQFLQWERELK
jgi:hypothetical protein